MSKSFFTKRRTYWILQIVGWSLYLLVNLILVSLIEGSLEFSRVLNTVSVAIYMLFTTHWLRNIIVKRKWLTLSLIKLIPRIFLVSFTFSLAITLLNIFVTLEIAESVSSNKRNEAIVSERPSDSPQSLDENTAEIDSLSNTRPNSNLSTVPAKGTEIGIVIQLAAYILTVMIFYFLWTLIYYVYNYTERVRTSLQYEAAAKEFELNNLKSQLNPHFIFNALNSIRALVDEDPQKSKLAITQLSNLLRNSLVMDKKKLTLLDDEVKTVRDYLALESIRFEERLRVHVDLHPDSRTYMVPPLMIQTLVENGIKHGISHLKEGGKLELKTSIIDDDALLITIRNSGQYVNGKVHRKSSSGFGITSTKKRLKLIFGPKASFRIFNENTDSVCTEIVIPKFAGNESTNY